MLMNGFAITRAEAIYSEPDLAWKVVGQGDFNGGGGTDLLWRHGVTGQVYLSLTDAGGAIVAGGKVMVEANPAWKIVGTPDFDGDGIADVLWWNSVTGQVYAMAMTATVAKAQGFIYTEPDTHWKIVAVGDFSGSGKRNQLVWRHALNGQVYLQTVDFSRGAFAVGGATIYSEPNAAWKIVAAADFNGDRKTDLLWRNDATGQVYMMLMNGTAIAAQAPVWNEPDLAWKIAASGDYNGDGRADILWRNDATGDVYMMLMNGFTIANRGLIYREPNLAWTILGPAEFAR
jgi:hypothetical protein